MERAQVKGIDVYGHMEGCLEIQGQEMQPGLPGAGILVLIVCLSPSACLLWASFSCSFFPLTSICATGLWDCPEEGFYLESALPGVGSSTFCTMNPSGI